MPPSVPAPDRAMVQLVPSQPPPSAERRSPARPTPVAAAPAVPVAVVRPLLDTASTPDLSSHSATPPPRLTPPGSSPDLCHLPKITAGPRAPRRQSLPPSSCTVSSSGPPPAAPAAASTAVYRRPLVRSCGRSVSQPTVQPSVLRQTRSVSVQREDCGHPATVTVAVAGATAAAPGAGTTGAGAGGGWWSAQVSATAGPTAAHPSHSDARSAHSAGFRMYCTGPQE